jgi:hypothetical protein
MVDTAMVHEGCPPWKPTPDSVVVAEYRYYDIPLFGVIQQGDRQYMFYCVDGADELLSLWWYAHITDEQRHQLDTAGENFEQVSRTMNFEGWGRLALATTNVGIVDYEDFDMDEPDGSKGFEVAFGKLQDRIHHLSSLADDLEKPSMLLAL